jgi:hypothetical protein
MHRGSSLDETIAKIRKEFPNAIESNKQMIALIEYQKDVPPAWYFQIDRFQNLYQDHFNKKSLHPKEKNLSLTQEEIRKENYEKLSRLMNNLEQSNELINLDDSRRIEINPGDCIYFHGSGTLELHKRDPEIVQINGQINNYKFVCNCSKKWFTGLSSRLFATLLDTHDLIPDQSFNFVFFGNVLQLKSSPEKLLILSALYIGGNIEDLQRSLQDAGFSKVQISG